MCSIIIRSEMPWPGNDGSVLTCGTPVGFTIAQRESCEQTFELREDSCVPLSAHTFALFSKTPGTKCA